MGVSKPFRFSYINAKCRALRGDLFTRAFFMELCESKNIADVYSRLKSTPYSCFIKEPSFLSIEEGLKLHFNDLYKKITQKLSKDESDIFDLFFFEKNKLFDKKIDLKEKNNIVSFKKIDIEFMRSIDESLKTLKKVDRDDLEKILGSYFDNINLYTIFRLRTIYNTKREDIVPFLFPYGLNYDIKKLNTFLDFTTLDQFSEALKRIYKDPFDDISSFRQSLYKEHNRVLNTLWHGYPFKISVLFALLRLKEIEIQNLNAILEGIKYDQPKKDIYRMIIGVK